MSHSCSGNCGSCGGCARELTLNPGELQVLDMFSEIPFLPVARKMGDLTPVYLEDERFSVEEYSLILQCLEKKGLISLDYDKPLKNFDASAYAAYPIRGSMALTQRGQQVLEMMEIQGLTEEK
jgi:hypothetical protein